MRQLGSLILNLLTALIELFLDRFGRRVVLEVDGKEGETRPRKGVDVVVVRELLHPFFQRLGNQVLHLLCSSPRPGCRDSEDLDRK